MKIPIKWIKEYVDIPEDLKIFTDKMSMIGHLLDKIEQTENDTVIDLELRGNRADCYSILGIAREWHACMGGRFDIPATKAETLSKTRFLGFEVVIQSPVVYRFHSTTIRGLKVGPSPEWMQKRLSDYGMESINNIVDITNYVMIETGMPMHAFDLARMKGSKLILKKSEKGQKFTTFDGTEKELTGEETVFGAEDGSILGIAGVIGSKDSGIHDDTVDILLECATYDRVAIRKTIFRHNLLTEAGLRHSHDISASLCDYALKRAIDLIIELAGEGDYSKIDEIDDYYPSVEQQKIIQYNISETKRLGGIEVSLNEQIDILKRLEFEVEIIDETNGVLNIKVPLFRTDIFESADIVEEVLRIYGYEKIPSRTLSDPIPEAIVLPELVMEEKIRDLLVGMGLNEVVTVPMATKEDLEKTLDPNISRSIKLINPCSSLHTHLRSNMYTCLLQALKRVLDRGDEAVNIFEVGKQYLKQDLTNIVPQFPHKADFPYLEQRRIAGLFSSKKNEWDFYKVKGIVEETLSQLGIRNVEYVKFEHPQFDLCASIRQGGEILGDIGIIKKEISQKSFDITPKVFAFILDIEALVKSEKTPKSYLPYSQYPEIWLDMSVLISKEVESSDIRKEIINNGGNLVRNVDIVNFFEKEGKRSVLFRIVYQSKERTLSLDEINALHIQIENIIKNKFGAIIQGREENPVNQKNNNSLKKLPEELSTIPVSKDLTNQSENDLTKTSNGFIVIGKIIEITQHPNADRLVICKVNVGKAKPEGTMFADYLQIITGADNIKPGIAEGKIVPVALPGAVVKSHKTGENIKIGIGKLRGETSEGMLCSSDELELPNPGYDGILILDEKMEEKVGEVFEK